MLSLVFYKAEGKFIDKLIKWWTSGKYSHCELVFSDGMSYSADAWQNKVRYEHINYNNDNWDFIDLGLNQKEELQVRAFADSQNGEKYDWLGIIASQIFPIGIEDKGRWFCSEICTAALQRVGKLTNFKASELDPTELALLLGLG